jgi:hypothetical protein
MLSVADQNGCDAHESRRSGANLIASRQPSGTLAAHRSGPMPAMLDTSRARSGNKEIENLVRLPKSAKAQEKAKRIAINRAKETQH